MALQYLRRIGEELDVVESYCVGQDLDGEFGVGAVYALKDIDAYRTYMFDPIHEQTDNAGLPIVSNQASYDITDDPDPRIGEKMAQVHRDRFAERPHLVNSSSRWALTQARAEGGDTVLTAVDEHYRRAAVLIDATVVRGNWRSLPCRMTITVMEMEDRTCPCHSPALPSLTLPGCWPARTRPWFWATSGRM